LNSKAANLAGGSVNQYALTWRGASIVPQKTFGFIRACLLPARCLPL